MGDEFTREEIEVLGDYAPSNATIIEDIVEGDSNKQPENENDLKEDEEAGETTDETEKEEVSLSEEGETGKAADSTEDSETDGQDNADETSVEKEFDGLPKYRQREIIDQKNKYKSEAEQLKQKHDLLRTNPEAYYQQYPYERPQTYQQNRNYEQQRPQHVSNDYDRQLDPSHIANLTVTGGQYEGMTLAEVYNVDPVYAARMQNDYEWNIRDARSKEQAYIEEGQKNAQVEIDNFKKILSVDMFGSNTNEVDREQDALMDKEIQNIIGVMETRGIKNLEDAYFIMNKDEILKRERQRGLKGVVDKVSNNNGVKSVSMGGTGVKNSSNDYANMDDGALEDAIDNMSDSELNEFLRTAPASLRRKHPGMPWM
jgi:uncharacterized protein YfbU (UPF0304 family)